MVLLLQVIQTSFVGDIDLLDGLEVVLLTLSATLTECLDLLSEGVCLGDQLLLVAGVLVRIFPYLDRSVRDVDLKLAPLDLRVTEKLLVDNYILLEVINNLFMINKTANAYLDLLIKGEACGLQVVNLHLALGQPSHHVGLREVLVMVQTGDGGIVGAVATDCGA